MSDIKLSQLPEVSSLSPTDIIPNVASGVTSKITVENLAGTMPQVSSSISASYALTASLLLGSIENAVSASYARTSSYSVSSSYAANGGVTQIIAGANVSLSPVNGLGAVTVSATSAAAFPYTGSAIISGSLEIIQTGSVGLVVTGSVVSTRGFSGSLFGTSSWAVSASQATSSSYSISSSFASNSISASYALSASRAVSSSYSISSSYALTASYAVTSSWSQNALSASYAATASWSINSLTASSADSFLVRNNLTASNALITGTITAQTLVVQYVTASTEWVTGSSKFGSLSTDTHQFTGSVSISGSLTVNGPLNATSSWAQNSVTSLTASFVTSSNVYGPFGSNSVLSASYASSSFYSVSSSYAITASYVELSQTSSFVTASNVYGPFGSNSVLSASYASSSFNSVSSSYALTSSYSGTSSYSINAQTASFITASNVYGPYQSNSVISSSHAVTASYVSGSVFSSTNLARSSSYAITASYALNGGGSTITVADEGVPKGPATFLNFVGSFVTATVSSNTASINIFVPPGTGSVALHTQASPSVTWSFNHNLNNDYPVLEVWDSFGYVMIPGGVKTMDPNNVEIYFDVAESGYASAVVGGSTVSASYALTASYVIGGASTINVQDEGSPQGSAGTINFVGDNVTAAVAGGIATVTVSSNPFPYTGSMLVTQSHLSTVDWIDFTIDPGTPAHLEGRAHWQVDRKTLELDTDVNNFSIPVGHSNVLRGRNTNSYTLTKGTVVYINGNSGQFATFGTASWENDANSAYTIGIVAQDINTSQYGYAVTDGEITGINTTAYAPATLLYLSASGQYTDQKPYAPLHTVRLGQVVVQSVNGTIQVKVDNGYEIDELHDVKTANTSSGDLLMLSGSLWVNSKQLTGSYGLTGSLYVSQSGVHISDGTSNFMIKAQSNYSVNTGTSTVSTISTGSYDGAFFDYVVKDGTNYRSGIVMAVWTPTTYSYSDNSVVDIGNTSGLILSVDLNSGQARLRATANSNNWVVKTFIRAI